MKKKKRVAQLEKISIAVTEWVGTTQSIIIHTILFIAIFALRFVGVKIDEIELILTTAVSLEAIYLALFIQMTVNRNTKSLEGVENDIDEIQEDVDDIGDDVDDLSKDIDEIQDREEEHHEKQVNVPIATLSSLETQLKRIEEQINRLEKKFHPS